MKNILDYTTRFWNSFDSFALFLSSDEFGSNVDQGAINFCGYGHFCLNKLSPIERDIKDFIVLGLKEEDLNKITENVCIYIFNLNNRLFGFFFNELDFYGICELDLAVISNSFYNEIRKVNYKNKYYNFGVDLKVDLKYYDRADCEKFVFSKHGKIEMLCALSLFNSSHLDLSEVVDLMIVEEMNKHIAWEKMVKEVNKRTEKILATKGSINNKNS